MKMHIIRCLLLVSCLGVAIGVKAEDKKFETPTLDRIVQTGKIRIGYGSTAPFSFLNADGQVVGYSIDLCRGIVEKLKDRLKLHSIDIEFVPRTPSNRVQLLNDGTMDIECNASTNTSERRKSVAFAYSHFYGATRYVSLRKNNLKQLDDLKGRSVSVALGTVNINEINEISRKRKLNISTVPVDSLQAAFDMVTDGRVAAFAMDEVLLKTMIARTQSPSDYVLSEEQVTELQPLGFMMRLNDEAFVTAVNQALNEIYKSEAVKGIYSRWFEEPMPGLNINLELPMSPWLIEALRSPQTLK
ncbi:amino acid ABC transporter substrate-binding protein [uncultured Agrobacterium sp.]|uniref:amino acid ABC transporter substrate-binding protein n=1 Tax=uncultured Agrobacterium sp. TaxID=157277 RepID=UPI0025F36A94|nr:amino acid ABC transporter substrate-binding protein [uncultured Agrobacterium sp.]